MNVDLYMKSYCSMLYGRFRPSQSLTCALQEARLTGICLRKPAEGQAIRIKVRP